MHIHWCSLFVGSKFHQNHPPGPPWNNLLIRGCSLLSRWHFGKVIGCAVAHCQPWLHLGSYRSSLRSPKFVWGDFCSNKNRCKEILMDVDHLRVTERFELQFCQVWVNHVFIPAIVVEVFGTLPTFFLQILFGRNFNWYTSSTSSCPKEVSMQSGY